MAIRKIDWKDKDHRLVMGQVLDVWEYTEPSIEGDELLVYFNDENQQACVYWKIFNGGMRVCLAQHIDVIMNLLDTRGVDHVFYNEIEALAAKKAEQAGFPKTWHEIEPGLTWRELIDTLQKQFDMFPELLDEPAKVWTPKDNIDCMPDFSTIINLGPYDLDDEPSEENFLSLSLLEW